MGERGFADTFHPALRTNTPGRDDAMKQQGQEQEHEHGHERLIEMVLSLYA